MEIWPVCILEHPTCKKYLTLKAEHVTLVVSSIFYIVSGIPDKLKGNTGMGLSFQEKSLWVMFVGLVAAFGYYFATVLPPVAVDVMPDQVAMFVLAVVFLVITQIVGNIVIAVVDRNTQVDERDRLIALKGNRNGGYVLATGVFLALCTALLTDGNFLFMHVLLAFWVLAELVEIGSRLFLYRRGV